MTGDIHNPQAATERHAEGPIPITAGAAARLTHEERVERVNAYLKASASRGIWSAIE